MTIKHTPKDWHVELDNRRGAPRPTIAIPIRIYSDSPGPGLPFTVALVEGCAGINGDVGRGNANLMAAAPDMYDALKLVLENLKLNQGKGLGIYPIVTAKAALAKAEGREEAKTGE